MAVLKDIRKDQLIPKNVKELSDTGLDIDNDFSTYSEGVAEVESEDASLKNAQGGTPSGKKFPIQKSKSFDLNSQGATNQKLVTSDRNSSKLDTPESTIKESNIRDVKVNLEGDDEDKSSLPKSFIDDFSQTGLETSSVDDILFKETFLENSDTLHKSIPNTSSKPDSNSFNQVIESVPKIDLDMRTSNKQSELEAFGEVLMDHDLAKEDLQTKLTESLKTQQTQSSESGGKDRKSVV